MSFDYRKNEVRIKRIKKKLENETDPLRVEMLEIQLEEKLYGRANMELVAKDRMREIEHWSRLKKEFNDGTFDTQNVNTHQFESLALIMDHKRKAITPGSSQAEVFNVLSQVDTIQRIKQEQLLTAPEKKEQLQYGKDNNK